MMEEGRPKVAPDAAQEPTEQVADAPKPPPAKAVIRKSSRKAGGGAKRE
jgi:hypothetical protein